MTMQIQTSCSTKFVLDLNNESGNLSKVNKINALISLCAVSLGKKSVCSVDSQGHYAVGLAEIDNHLSGADSGPDNGPDSGPDTGAARVNPLIRTVYNRYR